MGLFLYIKNRRVTASRQELNIASKATTRVSGQDLPAGDRTPARFAPRPVGEFPVGAVREIEPGKCESPGIRRRR